MDFIIEPKTKGLNFLEAVQAMKEGEKVRRKGWDKLVSNCSLSYMVGFSVGDYDSTDWEIVDSDDDWNLAKQWTLEIPDTGEKQYTLIEHVKKCRDLILDDIDLQSENFVLKYSDVVDIVNKRFGSLEGESACLRSKDAGDLK